MKLNNKNGFTLLELLIVVAIIGILLGVAIPAFSQYKTRAMDTDAKSNLHNLYLACKAYWGDKSSSPNCNVSIASGTTYGYLQSSEVSIAANGNEYTFNATASHAQSTNTFTINSQGTIN